MEPTENQLALREVLMDMKQEEYLMVRAVRFPHIQVKVVGCKPFINRGIVYIETSSGGHVLERDMPSFLDNYELVDVDLNGEYMVSVDGMGAPRKVHPSYNSACDEAERLARQNIGKRVRVLKVEHVIKAEQTVEVKECR